ncbi:MAG: 50S ribosomal protein L31e [Thermoprotei archaeon]|nr:MAG: 50S ribosomal protein L31e [Thermoprotei archaeon]RLF19207.1 MAG: 50S ribosomal protein L31e [Thermoprotei archaeon]
MSSEEGKVILEREYVIPLRKVYSVPRTKRASRAIRLIREFIKRHVKAEVIKISPEVNEYVWRRGREKPPRRVAVRVKKYEDNTAVVELLERP